MMYCLFWMYFFCLLHNKLNISKTSCSRQKLKEIMFVHRLIRVDVTSVDK